MALNSKGLEYFGPTFVPDASKMLLSPPSPKHESWVMGGIGKTTLAKVLYMKIRWKFEISCTLDNVRETLGQRHGLLNLQRELCSKLKIMDTKIEHVCQEIDTIRNFLFNKKVLLVVDMIRLKNRIPTISNDCPRCENSGETILHSLSQCAFAYDVRTNSTLPTVSHASADTYFWRWWIRLVTELKRRPQWRRRTSEATSFLWTLWKDRNLRIFEGQAGSPASVVDAASKLIYEYHQFHPFEEHF
ncbi:hypothetical protein PIB30_035071 [Stylosanthes scabra]|uniref:NB-ARC domain-containing protein n=1 Tax=Stylosanthes scabra TaxID=79078 RepID=A0ABU6Z9W5_9FABA|nr:hypothetical protein [Stylosanthes scabra]